LISSGVVNCIGHAIQPFLPFTAVQQISYWKTTIFVDIYRKYMHCLINHSAIPGWGWFLGRQYNHLL